MGESIKQVLWSVTCDKRGAEQRVSQPEVTGVTAEIHKLEVIFIALGYPQGSLVHRCVETHWLKLESAGTV